MAFTPNKNLEQPARGSNVGTWDTPVNSNTGIIDNSFGGTATVAVAAAPVTLSPSQYQCQFINFTGVLTSNVAITFPLVGSIYSIENQTTGNFIITLQTTAAGSQVICAPPGEVCDIKSDGNTGNMKYRNLGRVGSYLDLATTTGIPAWINGCTVKPYLYCDGTAFSSATYPVLATQLGTTTLPDHRGRARFAYNDGTSRVTTAYGLNGDTIFSGGGAQNVTLGQGNIPNYNLTVTDPGHAHTMNSAFQQGTQYALFASGHQAMETAGSQQTVPNANTTGISVNSAGGGTAFGIINPGIVGGLTLIRAA